MIEVEADSEGSRQQEQGVMPLSGNLGERLQAVRKQQGLSQRELARRAEVTNSTLSMIEQGKVSPSVSSLEKILAAIPMSLQEFFSDTLTLTSPVFREADYLTVENEGVTDRILPLTEAGRDGIYLSQHTYAPGAKITSEWMARKGFVGGVVIAGQLTLKLEGNHYELTPGEGFHFSLHRSHTMANLGQQECVLISVSFSDRRA